MDKRKEFISHQNNFVFINRKHGILISIFLNLMFFPWVLFIKKKKIFKIF
jgi:hypothetical protein